MQQRILLIAIVLFGCLKITGCATHPDELPKAYVSPLAYSGYTCDQIQVELPRVADRINQTYRNLAEQAEGDAGQFAAALLMSGLMLFTLEGGDGPEAYEYSRLMGEYDSLLATAAYKECAFYEAGKIPQLWFAGEWGVIMFEEPTGRSFAQSRRFKREYFAIRLDWIAGRDERKFTNSKRQSLRVPIGRYAVAVSPHIDNWARDESKTFAVEIEPGQMYFLSGRRLEGEDWEPVLWAVTER